MNKVYIFIDVFFSKWMCFDTKCHAAAVRIEVSLNTSTRWITIIGFVSHIGGFIFTM